MRLEKQLTLRLPLEKQLAKPVPVKKPEIFVLPQARVRFVLPADFSSAHDGKRC